MIAWMVCTTNREGKVSQTSMDASCYEEVLRRAKNMAASSGRDVAFGPNGDAFVEVSPSGDVFFSLDGPVDAPRILLKTMRDSATPFPDLHSLR